MHEASWVISQRPSNIPGVIKCGGLITRRQNWKCEAGADLALLGILASCWKRSQAVRVETPCSRSVLWEGDSMPCHLGALGVGAGQLLQVERWEAQLEKTRQDWQASVITSTGSIQPVKIQDELSSRHYPLSVLWSWVNFLQLSQEIKKKKQRKTMRERQKEASTFSPYWGDVGGRS